MSEEKVFHEGETPQKSQAVATGKAARPPSSTRNTLTGILLAAILALAGGGLYLAFQNRDAGLSTQGTIQDLQHTVTQHVARFELVEDQLNQLREQQQALSRSIQDFMNAVPGSNEDWALMEIEFLLITATHHLQLEHDVATALAALQTAELRLRGLDNSALDPVREQLTGDINRLQQLPATDIRGLAVLLGDQAGLVHDLPLVDALREARVQSEEGTGPAPSRITGALAKLWHELRSLVVIRRADVKQQPIPAPDQEYFIYQNLRLELESARLSLLQRDTENLHITVALLQQWLKDYFDADDPAVINIMHTLQQLSVVELDPAVPDISSTMESLRAYMRASAEVVPAHADHGEPPS